MNDYDTSDPGFTSETDQYYENYRNRSRRDRYSGLTGSRRPSDLTEETKERGRTNTGTGT